MGGVAVAVMSGFCGPSNTQYSRNFDDEETINWFMQNSMAGVPKAEPVEYPRPSLTPFVTAGVGPIRALFVQDGRAFAVSGAFFYEFFQSQNVVIRGNVRVDGRPATISSNGKGGEQLFITSGGVGYIFELDTNTFSIITDSEFPTNNSGYAASGLFFDGFFLALDGVNGSFWLSALEDGTDWNGVDFGAVSTFSDKVIAMARTHDNLMLFGTKNSQLWYNSGASNFPFQPIPGGLVEHGIGAAFSCVEMDNTIYYLGRDEHGNALVWKLEGYIPRRISTPAIENYLRTSKNLTQVIGWGYQFMGNGFYALYVPDLDTQPVYNVSTGQWHKEALWDQLYMRWRPHVPRCHAFGLNDQHFFGDRQSGAIYTLKDYDDPLGGADDLVWTGPPVFS